MSKAKHGAMTTMTATEAYGFFLPQAQALHPRDVQRYTGLASVAYLNVLDAVEAIRSEEPRIKKELPTADLDAIHSLPNLALAMQQAVAHVEKAGVAVPQTRERRDEVLGRVHHLRRTMLAAAESHAFLGELSDTEVARIRSGRGPRDAAQDCIDLASLFRKEMGKLKGRSTVTETMLDEAVQAGTEALKMLRPTEAVKPGKPEELKTAIDIRDRLFTLLHVRYELAWRIGAWLWGFDVSRKVVSLRTIQRVGTSSAAAQAPDSGPGGGTP